MKPAHGQHDAYLRKQMRDQHIQKNGVATATKIDAQRNNQQQLERFLQRTSTNINELGKLLIHASVSDMA